MTKDNQLLKRIERTRQQMMDQAVNYGFSNEETIRTSQHLDNLLNRYDRCFTKIHLKKFK